jgi:hypothetical protein
MAIGPSPVSSWCSRSRATWGLLAGLVLPPIVFSSCVDQPLVALERKDNGGSGGNSGVSSSGNTGTGVAGSANPWANGGNLGYAGFPAGGSEPMANCSAQGQFCDGTSKKPCCGNLVCYGGTCTTQVCSQADGPCTEDSDCCLSLFCKKERGLCGQVFCNKVGETCTQHSECCSGSCEVVNGGNQKACQPVSGCLPIGESCNASTGWECCSGACAHNRCSAKERCGYSGEAHCDEPGNGCCQSLVCRPDSLDVPRCVSLFSCVGLNMPCSHDSACCPNASGTVSCALSENLHYRVCTVSQTMGTGGTSSTNTAGTIACAVEYADCSSVVCCEGFGLTCDPGSRTCVH